MSYKYLLYALLPLLLVSCGTSHKSKEGFQTYPGLEGRDGLYYKKGAEEPFTGSTESTYSTGTTFVAASFKKGKLHGTYTAYYANGQKMGVSHYKMGIKHGEAISWHENGEPASKVHYKQGKKDGLLVVYYPNGQKMVEAFYSEDQLDGGFTQWTREGALFSIKSYENGELLWEENYGNRRL